MPFQCAGQPTVINSPGRHLHRPRLTTAPNRADDLGRVRAMASVRVWARAEQSGDGEGDGLPVWAAMGDPVVGVP